jgi:hypothetical protein
MKLRWYDLREGGDDFLRSAPLRYVTSVDLPVPPEAAWAALTAQDALVSWSAVVTWLRWTSPHPFGVGTTREVTLLWLLGARERYYRWDTGRRKTFTAVSTTQFRGCVAWPRITWSSPRPWGRGSSGPSRWNRSRRCCRCSSPLARSSYGPCAGWPRAWAPTRRRRARRAAEDLPGSRDVQLGRPRARASVIP